ncbi:MAG: SEC-C metal-binding domain-containing protein [Solirubrobacteraceae bacterium]
MLERLGNNDPCPCGSGRRFQEVLPQRRALLTAPDATTTTGSADQFPTPEPHTAPGPASVAQRKSTGL